MMRDPKKPLGSTGRFSAENLVAVSSDERSVRRGRRAAPRTEVCRPCLFWVEDTPEDKAQGVLLDVSPYGMRLRTLETHDPGTILCVQMMRDEEFRVPLSAPIRVEVAYQGKNYEGFVDHGLRRLIGQVKKPREYTPIRHPGSHRPSTQEKQISDLGPKPRRLERKRGY
jgi:hypothetical protein